MSIAVPTKMTVEEFRSGPMNGTDQWLVNGVVRNGGERTHGLRHSAVKLRLARFIDEWAEMQPGPRGVVFCSGPWTEVAYQQGTLLRPDVALVDAKSLVHMEDDASLIAGGPLIVAAVLSPNDTQQMVAENVQAYQKAGIPHIWIVDPFLPQVRIYRPIGQVDAVGGTDFLTAEPDCPGLRIDMRRVFWR